MAEIDDEIVADSLQGITQTLTLKWKLCGHISL